MRRATYTYNGRMTVRSEIAVALLAAALLLLLSALVSCRPPECAPTVTPDAGELDGSDRCGSGAADPDPVIVAIEAHEVSAVEAQRERLRQTADLLREVARFDDYDLDQLLARRGDFDVDRLAFVVLGAADHHKIDPPLLALVLWNESKFDPHAVGGDGAWCGIGQILGAESCGLSAAACESVQPYGVARPLCQAAIDDWVGATYWSAGLIRSFADRPECDGSPCLMYYWGEGETAGRNERRMWRRAATLRDRGFSINPPPR